jgi:hypothetical protein
MHELTVNYGVTAMLPNAVIVTVGGVVLALLIPACAYFMYERLLCGADTGRSRSICAVPGLLLGPSHGDGERG